MLRLDSGDDTQATAVEIGLSQLAWQIAPPAASSAAPDSQDKPDLLPTVKDDDDLDRVLRDFFQIKLPNVAVCQGHVTPWVAFHDAFFARVPVSVWKASRGFGGKSFTLALLALAEGIFLRADVTVLGGSGEQSKRVLESTSKLWEVDTAPRQVLAGNPGSEVQRLIWGNKIKALQASQSSVRGPHPQRMRCDEVDEMRVPILRSALGQPMSKGWVLSQVVLSSTHQYPNGTMTWALKEAAAKGWQVCEWCLHETMEPHGWLSLAEVERKKAVMTTADWETEVELQEPSAVGRAFDQDKVREAFRADITLEEPVDGALYSTGADWAKKVNHTVPVTIRYDVTPARVVAIQRTQKRPWPDMVKDFDSQAERYPGNAIHDNTGIGGVIHDLITVDAEPFNMVGRQRAELLSEYIAAIEKGDLIWPQDPTNDALAAAKSEHVYATREDIYKGTKDGSGSAHLPDTISAAALAWRGCRQVKAAGQMQAPQPATTTGGQLLQQGVRRGRLSGYVLGNRHGHGPG